MILNTEVNIQFKLPLLTVTKTFKPTLKVDINIIYAHVIVFLCKCSAFLVIIEYI